MKPSREVKWVQEPAQLGMVNSWRTIFFRKWEKGSGKGLLSGSRESVCIVALEVTDDLKASKSQSPMLGPRSAHILECHEGGNRIEFLLGIIPKGKITCSRALCATFQKGWCLRLCTNPFGMLL